MPIPKHDELTWPLLDILRDGQPRSINDLAKILSDRFRLTEEERNALIPRAVQTYILNRTGWAGLHLDLAGLITKSKRGLLVITPEGQQVLAGPVRKLDCTAMMQFPKFRERFARYAPQSTEAPAETDSTNQDLPPQEQHARALNDRRTAFIQALLGLAPPMDPVKSERQVRQLLLFMGYFDEEPSRVLSRGHRGVG